MADGKSKPGKGGKSIPARTSQDYLTRGQVVKDCGVTPQLISTLTTRLGLYILRAVANPIAHSLSAMDEAGQRPGSGRRVTRNDVASRAGVPPSTVSYVINNGPRPVSAVARGRVLEAIAELGYQPSEVARSLRTRRTMTIGLVIPDTANPFYGEVARAVEEVSFEQGYTVVLGHSSHLPERELRYAQVLRSKQVDGVIFHPETPDLSPVHFLGRAGIPTVVLERVVPGYHCIVADDYCGGYMATRHLLDLGHRRIGCVIRAGDPTSSVARVDGYRAALVETGIHPDERLIVGSEFGYAAGEAAARELLKSPERPTAVIAHNDIMAIGAMKALVEAGLSVPRDVSVVGFDDIALASYVQPPLTTVFYPKQQMGHAAAELLLQLLARGGVIPPKVTTLAVRLIVRGSTAPRR